jgi:putative transcriptional regulator
MFRGWCFIEGGFDMGKSRISNNIRKLRFFHNEMTQQHLAELVGVTRQTIIAMEQGKYSPSLELAFRIARVFDAPLEEVFSFEAEGESR